MFQSTHLYNKISIFGYIFLCFNFLFFGYLLATHKNYYHIFTMEDSYVEYMGFLLLLLTSFLLFLSARKKPFRWLYLIFVCVFAWAAAEEISWGQRIFGFKIPAFLQALNTQNELNIHNINKRFFDRLYDRASIALCLITSITFFFKKHSIFRIPLPSVLLMYCFILTLSYEFHREIWVRSTFQIGYLILLIFAVYQLLSKQRVLLAFSILTIVIMIGNTLFNHHFRFQFIGGNSANEVREYLFGFVCCLYAWELLLARRKGEVST